jgi:hypothetical protein
MTGTRWTDCFEAAINRGQPRPTAPGREVLRRLASPSSQESGDQSWSALARRLLLLPSFQASPAAQQVAGLTQGTRGKSGAELVLQALLGHARVLRQCTNESLVCCLAAPLVARRDAPDSDRRGVPAFRVLDRGRFAPRWCQRGSTARPANSKGSPRCASVPPAWLRVRRGRRRPPLA